MSGSYSSINKIENINRQIMLRKNARYDLIPPVYSPPTEKTKALAAKRIELQKEDDGLDDIDKELGW